MRWYQRTSQLPGAHQWWRHQFQKEKHIGHELHFTLSSIIKQIHDTFLWQWELMILAISKDTFTGHLQNEALENWAFPLIECTYIAN